MIGLGSLPFSLSLSIIRRKGMIEFLALYANGRREYSAPGRDREREALLFLPIEMDFSIFDSRHMIPSPLIFCVCLYKFNDLFFFFNVIFIGRKKMTWNDVSSYWTKSSETSWLLKVLLNGSFSLNPASGRFAVHCVARAYRFRGREPMYFNVRDICTVQPPFVVVP